MSNAIKTAVIRNPCFIFCYSVTLIYPLRWSVVTAVKMSFNTLKSRLLEFHCTYLFLYLVIVWSSFAHYFCL